MKLFISALILSLFLAQCRPPKEDKTVIEFSGKPEVPGSIKKEHEYLLAEIGKLTLLNDSTGKIAGRLNKIAQHHFREEEDYVLPPLGYLPSLTNGNVPPQSAEVIGLTEKLKANMDHLSAEHQMIKACMKELLLAAAKENHPEVISLEKEISKHAATEDEVFFPAAIMIGEYLKLRLKDSKIEP